MYEKYVELREKKGVSDYRVAEDTGISKSTFSDWKSGRSKPKVGKLKILADYFDQLRKRNPKEWEYWMYRCCTDPATGEKYGWGRVLDYIGVAWEDEYQEVEQLELKW